MPGDDRESRAAGQRLTELEVLFMELQHTVEQLDSVVRAQQHRLDWIEQQLAHWRRAGSGDEPSDDAVDDSNPDSL